VERGDILTEWAFPDKDGIIAVSEMNGTIWVDRYNPGPCFDLDYSFVVDKEGNTIVQKD
jgi:hypothetical protein